MDLGRPTAKYDEKLLLAVCSKADQILSDLKLTKNFSNMIKYFGCIVVNSLFFKYQIIL